METFTSPSVRHRDYTFASDGTVWAPNGSRLVRRYNKHDGRLYYIIRQKRCYFEDVVASREALNYDKV